MSAVTVILTGPLIPVATQPTTSGSNIMNDKGTNVTWYDK